jgi:SpoVK/Ycf46/Vps4 family AAA+-type ATPase
LKDTETDPGFNVERLAVLTDGFSGSDLKELCRNAVMVPVREFISISADNHEALSKGQLEVRRGVIYMNIHFLIVSCTGIQLASIDDKRLLF